MLSIKLPIAPKGKVIIAIVIGEKAASVLVEEKKVSDPKVVIESVRDCVEAVRER